MRRARFDPAPLPEYDPAPAVERARGMRVAPLAVVAVVAAGVAVRFVPQWTPRQRQALIAAAALWFLCALPPVQWLARKVWPERRRRWLAGCWAGGLVAGWSVGYMLLVPWAAAPLVLWGASRGGGRRVAQRSEDVKPDGREAPNLEERWQSAATRTGLVHPAGPAAGKPLLLAGPPVPNGVGGQALTVILPPGLTPDSVAGRTGGMRRWHLGSWVYVRPAGGDPAVLDRAEVHCYDQRPLAARPIPWQWLGDHYVPGVHAVPYAADVHGDPLHLDMRKCTLLVGESRSGKTGVQLAMVAGCALAGIPMRLHLADNRSGGDRELSALRSAAFGYARSAPEAWHEVHSLEREIALRRDAGVSEDGRTYYPTEQWPLVHLCVTELLALLTARTSRPPTDAELAERFELDWSTYTGGRFERRPAADDWLMMIAESIGGVAREGASVGVSASYCTQGAQLDISPTMRHARRHIPQNIATRLRTGSDVDPALGEGALAAGAYAHLLPPDVPGLLYVRPDGMTVVHGRGAHVPSAELADVAALLTAVHTDHAAWSHE